MCISNNQATWKNINLVLVASKVSDLQTPGNAGYAVSNGRSPENVEPVIHEFFRICPGSAEVHQFNL